VRELLIPGNAGYHARGFYTLGLCNHLHGIERGAELLVQFRAVYFGYLPRNGVRVSMGL